MKNNKLPLDSTSPFHIPSLDGWRAVAIAIVFFSHAGFGNLIPGLFGVTIFFFISGYLITTLLRREWDRFNDIDLRQFYWRRGLRLLPPLYLVLAASIVVACIGLTSSSFRWSSVVAQALYLANYYSIYMPASAVIPGTDITWSLAVEEHFYVLFPVLFLLLYRSNLTAWQRASVLWGLCAAVLIWRMHLVMGPTSTLLLQDADYVPRISHATDTRLDAILFGCILGCYKNPVLDASTMPTARLLKLWLPASMLLMMSTFLIRAPWFRETFRHSLQAIALFPVFVASIRLPDHILFRPLNWAWVRWIGATSYGLYLIHGPLLQLHWPQMPRLIAVTIQLSLALALTALMYYGVEKPVARLRAKWGSPRRVRTYADTSVAVT